MERVRRMQRPAREFPHVVVGEDTVDYIHRYFKKRGAGPQGMKFVPCEYSVGRRKVIA